jgi:TRAP-type C4-dicarboxylate transport system substrate-binding protein
MRKLALSLCAAAMAASATAIASAETIKVGAVATETSMTGKMDTYFAKQVEEISGGDLKFQFFWGGAAGAGTEIIPLIKGGVLQVGSAAPGWYASELPVSGLVNSVPFIFPDADTAMTLQDKLSRENSHYLAEYERVGVFPIAQHGLAATHLMCNKPIRKVEDLAGVRVRSYGSFLPIALEALGMVPVSMQPAEMYENLQRGVIDCAPVAYSTALDFKLHEVAKYWSDINLGAISGPALYTSFKNYKQGGWSPERITAIDEAAQRTLVHEREAWVNEDASAIERAKAGGVELIALEDPEKLVERVPDMLAIWEKAQVERGLDAAVAAELVATVKAELGR